MYKRTGRLPYLGEKDAELEYYRSMRFLKELTSEMLLFAGFHNDQIARKAIQKVIDGTAVISPRKLATLQEEATG